jgi:lipopolysaccharide assembly protein A
MQFLKTLLWVVIAVIAVIFSFNNWTPVTINLWNGLQLDTQLPVLMIGAFFFGVIPFFLLHQATRWSLTRKLANAERSLSEYRGISSTTPIPGGSAIPPTAAPIAVPPGVL